MTEPQDLSWNLLKVGKNDAGLVGSLIIQTLIVLFLIWLARASLVNHKMCVARKNKLVNYLSFKESVVRKQKLNSG